MRTSLLRCPSPSASFPSICMSSPSLFTHEMACLSHGLEALTSIVKSVSSDPLAIKAPKLVPWITILPPKRPDVKLVMRGGLKSKVTLVLSSVDIWPSMATRMRMPLPAPAGMLHRMFVLLTHSTLVPLTVAPSLPKITWMLDCGFVTPKSLPKIFSFFGSPVALSKLVRVSTSDGVILETDGGAMLRRSLSLP